MWHAEAFAVALAAWLLLAMLIGLVTGGGVRRALGEALAIVVVVAALVTLVWGFAAWDGLVL